MDYTDKEYCLEVWGDWACFSRPELKVERVSYDVITPSAARAIFEAILFKRYAMRWQVTKIEVLRPIKWATIRRNEVGAVVNSSMKPIYIDDGKTRQQKNTLLLLDVRYRIYAKLVFIPVKDRPTDVLRIGEVFYFEVAVLDIVFDFLYRLAHECVVETGQ